MSVVRGVGRGWGCGGVAGSLLVLLPRVTARPVRDTGLEVVVTN